MRFAKRMTASVVRRIYRGYFQAPLWRFLANVKGVFFVETLAHLENIERTLREADERRLREEIESIQRENLNRLQQGKVERSQRIEARSQLEGIERRIASIEAANSQREAVSNQRWLVVEERLRNLEANNTAQWDSLEQLLLAMFRQSEVRASGSEEVVGPLRNSPITTAGSLERVHAAGNLR